MGAHNLPLPGTRFIGRGDLVRELSQSIKVSPFITLVGVGGVCKSRLALEVAERIGNSFDVGCFYLNFSQLPSQTSVKDAVLETVVGTDHSRERPGKRLLDHIGKSSVLLVLDNCEHVSSEVESLLTELLAQAPGLRVLATSRHAFGTLRERVVEIPPLALPETSGIKREILSSDAVKLFLERAGDVRPEALESSEQLFAIERVCKMLDGNPLAIELAASRVRTFSVSEIEERLVDRFNFLKTQDREVPERHRSLHALIDWSWGLCDFEESMLWQRASVFRGGFTLAALEHVCADESLPEGRVWEILDQLVKKSIIQADGLEGTTRYRMLDSIAEFGRDRLRTSGEAEQLRRQHRDFFLNESQRSVDQWASASQDQVILVLRRERANMAQALEWSFATPGEQRVGATLVNNLFIHWAIDGYLRDGRKWTEQALEATSAQD